MTYPTKSNFKKLSFTLLYYLIITITVWQANKLSPSGPCTPGLGMLALMMSVCITPVLLVVNAYLTLFVDKSHQYSMMLHGLVVLGGIALIFIASMTK